LEREFKAFKEKVKQKRRGGEIRGLGHPQRKPTPWPGRLNPRVKEGHKDRTVLSRS